jgi:transcriptional regulator with XRE-family HTH domain
MAMDDESSADGFGSRLRSLRRELGLSQAQLAGDAMSLSYVSHLEAGRRSPSRQAVQHLAQALGVSPEELLGPISPDATVTVDVEAAALLTAAEAHLGMGDLDHARLLVVGLDPLQLPVAARCRLGSVQASLAEADGDLAEAIARLQDVRNSVRAHPHAWPLLPVVIAMCRCYRLAGDLAQAIAVGEECLALADALELKHLQDWPQTVATLAAAYQERGDLSRAAYLLDSVLHAPALDAKQRGALAWNSSILASQRGLHADAQRLALQAQHLLQEHADDIGTARIRALRAWIELQSPEGDPSLARAMLSASLETFESAGLHGDRVNTLVELRARQLVMDDLEEASATSRRALELSGAGMPIEYARAAVTYGRAQWLLGDPELGGLELELATDALASAGVTRESAAAWADLADLCSSVGQHERAADAYRRALMGAGIVVTARDVARAAAPR